MHTMNENEQGKTALLPLKDPIMRTWPEHNFLVSVIRNKEGAYEWIMNSYIQACYFQYEDQNTGLYYYRMDFFPGAMHHQEINLYDLCPFIEKSFITKEQLLNQYPSFTDFLIYAINNGYYVAKLLDQFFIPRMKGETGFFHPNYVFGCDSEKQVVNIADNLDDGRFAFLEVPFDKINQSFGMDNIYDRTGRYHNTYLYKLRDYSFRFDIRFLVATLKEYLLSENSTDSFRKYNNIYKVNDYDELIWSGNKVLYGIGCYDFLIRILSDSSGRIQKDWRSFCYLIDHKVILKLRIEYLARNGYLKNPETLLNEAESLLLDCNKCLGIFMKYLALDDGKYIERIINYLEGIKVREKNLLETMVELLSD